MAGPPSKKQKTEDVATAMARVEDVMAPSSFRDELRETAKRLVTKGKGLLACDEPPHVLPNRMKMCWSDKAECDEGALPLASPCLS